MLKSLLSNLYIYLIVAGISSVFTGYAAYSLTSDHYIAKIELANTLAEKEKNEIQEKGDKLVKDYIDQIDKLSANNSSLQRQVSMAVGDNQCVISAGFVRLFNASTTGESSAPSSTDGTSSTIDEATLLSVSIENNEKYLRLVDQLTKLQEFNK